jgi:O-antigen/teichoic acid export membrane protein
MRPTLNRGATRQTAVGLAPRISASQGPQARIRHGLADLAGSEFIRGFGTAAATRVAILLIGIVTSVFITRSLGPDGRGQFATAMAITVIGSQFGYLGLNIANIRVSARTPSAVGSLVGNSLFVSFVVAGLACLAGLGLAMLFPQLSPLPLGLLTLALIAVPFNVAFGLVNSLYLGLSRINESNAMQLLNRVGSAVLIIVVIVAGSATAGIVFGLVNIALVLSLTLFAYLLVRGRWRPRLDLRLAREHARFVAVAFAATTLLLLLTKVDVLIVQFALGDVPTGYYAVASSLVETLRFFPAIAATLLLARLAPSHRAATRVSVVRLAGLSMAGLMTAVALVAAVLATPVITLLYGADFDASVAPFLLLLPGLVMGAVSSVLMSYFWSVGESILTVAGPLAGLIVNVALNLLLLPILGVNGAAVASSISWAVVLVVGIVYASHIGWRAASRVGTDDGIVPEAPESILERPLS